MRFSSHARLSCAIVLGLLSGAASSQNRPVAFPNGSLSGTWCNFGPLGEEPNGSFTEARTQILIPAEYLPSRTGVITALDHIPTWNAMYSPGLTVQYSSLEITVAHRARGAGPLSLTFANNLPSPPPAPVLPAQPLTVTWVQRVWHSIGFPRPFRYDGVSDLVVEIKKVVQPTGQNTCSLRNLNPPSGGRAIMALGGPGSGASNAVTGTTVNVLGWRLHFNGVPDPTLEVRSPLDPVTRKHFTPGSTPHFRLYAPNGDLFGLFLGIGGFLPSPVVVPPVSGGLWLPPLTAQTMVIGFVMPVPGTQFQRIDFSLPNSPRLTGLRVSAQGATTNPLVLAPSWTNAVDFVIQ